MAWSSSSSRPAASSAASSPRRAATRCSAVPARSRARRISSTARSSPSRPVRLAEVQRVLGLERGGGGGSEPARSSIRRAVSGSPWAERGAARVGQSGRCRGIDPQAGWPGGAVRCRAADPPLLAMASADRRCSTREPARRQASKDRAPDQRMAQRQQRAVGREVGGSQPITRGRRGRRIEPGHLGHRGRATAKDRARPGPRPPAEPEGRGRASAAARPRRGLRRPLDPAEGRGSSSRTVRASWTRNGLPPVARCSASTAVVVDPAEPSHGDGAHPGRGQRPEVETDRVRRAPRCPTWWPASRVATTRAMRDGVIRWAR